MTESQRIFQDTPATRQRVPVLVGLVGPSGSGKTYSALRLATGLQRVTGGDVGFVDTEARRALHYADRFKFRHLAFGAPFSPLDYLGAIEHFAKAGVKTIIVDSMSHEHEGPGGVLEMHEAKLDKLAGDDYKKRERMTFVAWAEPKAQRRRLINSILQMDINAIFCFRAKEKIKIVRGEQPIQLGWMPIAGEEFVYEMTVNCLLYPAGGGVPVWAPNEVGEKSMVKLPEQFKELFSKSQPLDEATGETLAKWAAGDAPAKPAANPTTGGGWASILAKLAALGGDDAEKRILAKYGRASAAELTNVDGNAMMEAGKRIKAGSSKFADEFPEAFE